MDGSWSYARFDSLTALRAHCREAYATDDVWAGFDGRELMVRVKLADGAGFEMLVIHLEGERAYLVRLPDLGSLAKPLPASGGNPEDRRAAAGLRASRRRYS